MPKKVYDSDSSSSSSDDEQTPKQSAKQINKKMKAIHMLIKKHHVKHGCGFFDDIKGGFENLGNKIETTFQPVKKNLENMGSMIESGGKQVGEKLKQGGKKQIGKVGKYVTDKNGLSSDLLYEGLPVATGALGSVVGSMTGNPYGAFVGNVGGKMAGQQLANYIGDKEGMRRRRGRGMHIDILSHNAGTRGKTGEGFFTDLANDLRPITTDPRVAGIIDAGLSRGADKIGRGRGRPRKVHDRSGQKSSLEQLFENHLKKEDKLAKKEEALIRKSKLKKISGLGLFDFKSPVKEEPDFGHLIRHEKEMRENSKNKPIKKVGLGFKKGSQEAKDHMARIRAMKKK
jgi:hypothetical protein